MFNWEDLVKAVEEAFGGWTAGAAPALVPQAAPRGVVHVTQETNQSQIGLAFDTIPEAHPDSILMQTAMNVLSGGMGARLFTVIREKQGMCYSVQAGYSSLKHTGAIFGYSGTSP
jgi:predicted Zn-dependent peptidase